MKIIKSILLGFTASLLLVVAAIAVMAVLIWLLSYVSPGVLWFGVVVVALGVAFSWISYVEFFK